MQVPAVGHCSVDAAGSGVKSGTITYSSGIVPVRGWVMASSPASQRESAPLDGGSAQKKLRS